MTKFKSLFSLTPLTKEQMAEHIQATRELQEGKRCIICGSKMEEWNGTVLPAVCDKCMKKE